MMNFLPTIGLEVHAHLATKSKMFCGCKTDFGAEPNVQTCPVCIGMPGTLPVPNELAIDYAIRVAVALNCNITQVTYFDRKNYYYPDLPKNYQISQCHNNLGDDGWIDIDIDGETMRINIDNVHLEEDAGKLVHSEGSGARYSEVDLNRTGTPLLEVVTRPDMHTLGQVEAFMNDFRSMLLYMGVCDCKMQEGSLRFEASVSVAPEDASELGPRCELKNLNSMKSVLKAAEYEIGRQTSVLNKGGQNTQETRLWDDERGVSARMRRKEGSADYRYFPEPDLIVLNISDERLAKIRDALPEFAGRRSKRFQTEYGLPAYDAGVLVADAAIADYFETLAAEINDPKAASNWIMTEILREMNDRKIEIEEFSRKAPAQRLGELIKEQKSGTISHSIAKDIFAEMVETGKDALTIIERKGLRQISDTGELDAIVEKVLAENPSAVEDFKSGKKQAVGFLVGQIMRETKGKANPKVVNKLLAEKLG